MIVVFSFIVIQRVSDKCPLRVKFSQIYDYESHIRLHDLIEHPFLRVFHRNKNVNR